MTLKKRKKVPSEIEAEVLLKSARRCCLCYGLNGDFTEKRGQIAHIDHDSSNYKLDNIVFLCLDHHDLHDTTTSQSKGYTEKEIKFHRKNLYEAVTRKFPDNKRPLEDEERILTSCFLNDFEIEKSTKSGSLLIDPFDPNELGTCGYILHVGNEALTDNKLTHISADKPLSIKKGTFALVSTMEFISLPPGMIGQVHPFGAPMRIGLFASTQNIISPGYRGRLVIGFQNLGQTDITIPYKASIALVMFILINEARPMT